MTDRLLRLAQHPWGQRLLRAVRLPEPQRLARWQEAYGSQELTGRQVLLIGIGASPLLTLLSQDVAAEGGVLVTDPMAKVATLVVDASEVETLDHLHQLFRQVQAAQARLMAGGRVLLLAADSEEVASAPHAAMAHALQGFGRSLAKELGRRGSTANTLLLTPGASQALSGALRFFGTDRSAYVSGQVLRWRGASPAEAAPGTLGDSADAPDAAGRRLAVVTGAAGGIGAATVARLARDGFRVLCVDIPAAGDALAVTAAAAGGDALALDLTHSDTPAALAAAVAERGGVDLMVHNAGITRDRTLGRMSAAEWDSVLAVNLGAIASIDAMLDARGLLRPGAREVCLSSISGIAGNAGQTNYSASKAGLIGYVMARAKALRQRGITVNAVAPGFIETPMTQRMPMMIREAGRRLNSLKQGGRPEDVAEAIAFLATPEAQPLSGTVLRVCGQSLLGA